MSDRSKIEWTEATWNPVTGCTEVSEGCDHCYAKTFAERFRGVPGHPYEQGFDLKLWPERLDQPLRWKRPRMIFVNSMSDLFHDQVPDEFIAGVWAVMHQAHQHSFQVLTKRRVRDIVEQAQAAAAAIDPALGEAMAPIVEAVIAFQDYDPEFSLDHLLAELALGGAGGPPTVGGGVKVASLHRTKGLQWPHVYILGLEEGRLPDYRAHTPAEIREERRACFVGGLSGPL